jgi:iron complex transport system substrate-binding protein
MLKRKWISACSKWMSILLASLFTVHYSLSSASYVAPPNRIVSLAPSITEILFAAGLGDRVVGVTTFCDYPEEAKKKPKIGGMSNPSLEAVVTLRPDLVVLTTDGNPKEFEHKLRSVGIKTYVFKSLTLADLPKGIRDMGIALDAKDRFDTLASKIEQAINRFRDQGSKVGNQKVSINHASRMTHYALPRKKVLFIIWPQPLIVAGPRTAIHDAITLLGGINIAGKAKSRYPRFSLEEVIRQAPDIIFIGKGHEDIEELSSILLKRLSMVPAVKNKKVFYVSDSLYRLGPRIIDGIEELARYLLKK